MSFFLRLFKSIRLRLRSSRYRARRTQDEEDHAHQRSFRGSRHSEPPPNTGNQAPAARKSRRRASFDTTDHGRASVLKESAPFGAQTENRPDTERQRPLFCEETYRLEASYLGNARNRGPAPDSDHSDTDEVTDGERPHNRRRNECARTAIPPPPLLTRPLKLKKKHKDVIRALFPHPELSPAPNEVRWDDFKGTMARLGITANTTKGSAHRLNIDDLANGLFQADSTGKKVNAYRSHKPNRKSTLSRSRMREIGEKLNEAYGWTAETFLPLFD
ncbi:hypothetical protein F5Y14DRAFT_460151 [Nemania sp. NC0429]|nr:hypothetical protein F5Y14DRAFT_460151 [Nemania sp. NC0429]